jgi:eukaryotic translation initiation factor 2C
MEVYNMQIRFPKIIGVRVSPKNADNPVIYPAEICQILPGQFYKKKIPEEVSGKAVLDFATIRPAQRLDLIKKGIDARGVSAKCPTPVTTCIVSLLVV